MNPTSVEIAEIFRTVAPDLNVNSLAQQIRQYGREYCKKQVARCRMAYSANRYENPLKIKEAILKAGITDFE